MILTAIVLKNKNQLKALIPSTGGCAGKALFKAGNSIFEFSNPEKLHIKEGDIIKIESSPSYSILTSFIFFILPLFIIMAVYFLSGLFIRRAWITLLLAGASLLPTLLIARLFSKLTYHHFKPKVIEIISELPPACTQCSGCGTR